MRWVLLPVDGENRLLALVQVKDRYFHLHGFLGRLLFNLHLLCLFLLFLRLCQSLANLRSERALLLELYLVLLYDTV